MSKDTLLYYDEIFLSIQGESSDSGLPCVFVRLYGCNVGCSYCDQPQTPSMRKRISIANIVSRVLAFRIPYVCITGGEPLMQWNAIYPVILELLANGCRVSIETSGCYPIDFDPYNRSFKYIMDVKCPSSGVSHKNIYDNLMKLRMVDEVKFVISDREDYEFAKHVLSTYQTSASILFSPCFDEELNPKIGKELVEWVLEDRLSKVRIQLQLHKILGVK